MRISSWLSDHLLTFTSSPSRHQQTSFFPLPQPTNFSRFRLHAPTETPRAPLHAPAPLTPFPFLLRVRFARGFCLSRWCMSNRTAFLLDPKNSTLWLNTQKSRMHHMYSDASSTCNVHGNDAPMSPRRCSSSPSIISLASSQAHNISNQIQHVCHGIQLVAAPFPYHVIIVITQTRLHASVTNESNMTKSIQDDQIYQTNSKRPKLS